MTAQVCVSVSAPDIQELLGKVQQAERLTANLIEVRLDKLRSHQGLSKLARSVGRPLIATNRPLSEKGSYAGSEKERLRILQEAVEGGFEYVDLEIATKGIDAATESLREKGGKIILSHHDNFRTPNKSNLKSVLSQLQRQTPDVCKIVTTAKFPQDNLAILRFLQENHRNSPLVGFAMGRAGVWSRLLAPFHGSAFTYASLGKGMETAPGQITISEMRTIYDTLGLD